MKTWADPMQSCSGSKSGWRLSGKTSFFSVLTPYLLFPWDFELPAENPLFENLLEGWCGFFYVETSPPLPSHFELKIHYLKISSKSTRC